MKLTPSAYPKTFFVTLVFITTFALFFLFRSYTRLPPQITQPTGPKPTVPASNLPDLPPLLTGFSPADPSLLDPPPLELWTVTLNKDLLTDTRHSGFLLNLPDGFSYRIIRLPDSSQPCDQSYCTFKGFLAGRECAVQDVTTGSCSPGETILFTLQNDYILGTIPFVLGYNPHTYTFSTSPDGLTNYLSKLDPSFNLPD